MRVKYHSWLITLTGCNEEELNLPEPEVSIAVLAEFLAKRHNKAAAVFEIPEAMRYIVDRQYVTPEHIVSSSDAVEIYPPVTGG